MAPLEPWEKVFVNAETFPETDHGEMACVDCHGGQDVAEMDDAHEGMISRPGEGGVACADCHEEQTALVDQNLHFTLEGYWTVLEGRGADRAHEGLDMAFTNHCSSCHTSCGDCHVGQPASVGGGLLDGHVFTSEPPMTRTCTACHGSRVGNEYLGKNEGVQADVHFRSERMVCIDCHEGAELHGDITNEEGEPPNHRYDGVGGAQCTDCHLTYGSDSDEVREHRLHDDTLSCQVCHSTTYINCSSCHVQVSEESGNPFFTTEESWFTFLIGRNTRQSDGRPYEYVPVRHVPIDTESFAFYGENLLPNFDDVPTWHYATPHNIQRNTPQTETCNSCHGNADIFLTADKVSPEEQAANQGVIVDSVPEPREEN